MGVSRDCPIFSGTPYYLRNGKSYSFQIWSVYSEGPCEQKPIKNFREKGAWVYRGTAQFFRVPPIISGTGKATDLKFGRNIHSVHPNKSPLKFWGGWQIFLGTPYYLWNEKSYGVQILYALLLAQSEQISGKVAVGVVRDSRKFSRYPYIGRIARSSLR